jgi:ADP-ribosylglycohydrolase
MGQRFVKWFFEGYWTAGGEVFGVGKSTEDSITRLRDGVSPLQSGNYANDCYGNGSLMRILPLLFYIRDMDIEERYRIIREVAVITHGSVRTILACFYYLEFALTLLNGEHRLHAYFVTMHRVRAFIKTRNFPDMEVEIFDPLLYGGILSRKVDTIDTIHHAHLTIQAAIYCFYKTDSYKEAVLMAVNLGDDTDTTASVTGGLAGIYYGFESIPEKWISGIKRSDDINDLCNRLTAAMNIN